MWLTVTPSLCGLRASMCEMPCTHSVLYFITQRMHSCTRQCNCWSAAQQGAAFCSSRGESLFCVFSHGAVALLAAPACSHITRELFKPPFSLHHKKITVRLQLCAGQESRFHWCFAIWCLCGALGQQCCNWVCCCAAFKGMHVRRLAVVRLAECLKLLSN